LPFRVNESGKAGAVDTMIVLIFPRVSRPMGLARAPYVDRMQCGNLNI
jgi:hypothetical protein